MSEGFSTNYNDGDTVWVKLGPSWWPGEIKDLNTIPPDEIKFKKPPLAVVKFFEEDTYEYVRNWANIYPYNSEKKLEFIKKGMAAFRSKAPHMEKFPKDVTFAEVKTGGNPNILSDPAFRPEVKRNYIAEVFGTPSPKKKIIIKDNKKLRTPTKGSNQKDTAHITHRRFLGLDDYKAYICIQYPGKDRIPGDSEDEEVIRINTEPEQEYNCHLCSYSTKRLEVMILHTKSHIQGVYVSSPKRKRPVTGKPKKKDQNKKQRQSVRTWLDDTSSDEIPDPPKEKRRKVKSASSPKKPTKQTEEVKPKKASDIRSDLLAEWEDTDDELENSLELSFEPHTTNDLIETLSDTTGISKLDDSFDVGEEVVEETKKTENGNKQLSETEVEASENNTNEETEIQPKIIHKPTMDKETQEAIKSCFDFEEDEEEDLINTAVAAGRKIPRVIPPTEKRKSKILDDIIDLEEGINKDEILKVSQSFNEPHSEDKELDNAFKDLMEETLVPKLPEVESNLKPTQNFHCVKTIKFPDKIEEPPKKDREKNVAEIPSKLINPKKRFVKSFEDFENQLQREEIKRREEDLKKKIKNTVSAFIRNEKIPETNLENKKSSSSSDDDDSSEVDLGALQSKIMSKIIKEANINEESKQAIMSRINKKGTPRSKILDSYYNDTNKESETSHAQRRSLRSSDPNKIEETKEKFPDMTIHPCFSGTTQEKQKLKTKQVIKSSLEIDSTKNESCTKNYFSTDKSKETLPKENSSITPLTDEKLSLSIHVDNTGLEQLPSIKHHFSKKISKDKKLNDTEQKAIMTIEEKISDNKQEVSITSMEEVNKEAEIPHKHHRRLRSSLEVVEKKNISQEQKISVTPEDSCSYRKKEKYELTFLTEDQKEKVTSEQFLPEESQNKELFLDTKPFHFIEKKGEKPARKKYRTKPYSLAETKNVEKTDAKKQETVIQSERAYLENVPNEATDLNETQKNIQPFSVEIENVSESNDLQKETECLKDSYISDKNKEKTSYKKQSKPSSLLLQESIETNDDKIRPEVSALIVTKAEETTHKKGENLSDLSLDTTEISEDTHVRDTYNEENISEIRHDLLNAQIAEQSSKKNEEIIESFEDCFPDQNKKESTFRKTRRNKASSSPASTNVDYSKDKKQLVCPEEETTFQIKDEVQQDPSFPLGNTSKSDDKEQKIVAHQEDSSISETNKNKLNVNICDKQQDSPLEINNIDKCNDKIEEIELDKINKKATLKKKHRNQRRSFSYKRSDDKLKNIKQKLIHPEDSSTSESNKLTTCKTINQQDSSIGTSKLEKAIEQKLETSHTDRSFHSDVSKEGISSRKKRKSLLDFSLDFDEKSNDKKETMSNLKGPNLRSSYLETTNVAKVIDEALSVESHVKQLDEKEALPNIFKIEQLPGSTDVSKTNTDIETVQVNIKEKLKVPFKKSRWSRRMSHPKKCRESIEKNKNETLTCHSDKTFSLETGESEEVGKNSTEEIDPKETESKTINSEEISSETVKSIISSEIMIDYKNIEIIQHQSMDKIPSKESLEIDHVEAHTDGYKNEQFKTFNPKDNTIIEEKVLVEKLTDVSTTKALEISEEVLPQVVCEQSLDVTSEQKITNIVHSYGKFTDTTVTEEEEKLITEAITETDLKIEANVDKKTETQLNESTPSCIEVQASVTAEETPVDKFKKDNYLRDIDSELSQNNTVISFIESGQSITETKDSGEKSDFGEKSDSDSLLVNGCKVETVFLETDKAEEETDAVNSISNKIDPTSEITILCSDQNEEFSVGNTSLELPEDAIYEPSTKLNKRKRNRRKSAKYSYRKKRKSDEVIESSIDIKKDENVENTDIEKEVVSKDLSNIKSTLETTNKQVYSDEQLQQDDKIIEETSKKIVKDNIIKETAEDTIFKVKHELSKLESLHDTHIEAAQELETTEATLVKQSSPIPDKQTETENLMVNLESRVTETDETKELKAIDKTELFVTKEKKIVNELNASQFHPIVNENEMVTDRLKPWQTQSIVVGEQTMVEPDILQESIVKKQEHKTDESVVTQESSVVDRLEPWQTQSIVVEEQTMVEPDILQESIVKKQEHKTDESVVTQESSVVEETDEQMVLKESEQIVTEEQILIEESLTIEESVINEQPEPKQLVPVSEAKIIQTSVTAESAYLIDSEPKVSDTYTFTEQLSSKKNIEEKSDQVLESCKYPETGDIQVANECISKDNFQTKLEPKKNINFGDMDDEDEKLTDLVSDIVQKLNQDDAEKNQEDLDIELEEKIVVKQKSPTIDANLSVTNSAINLESTQMKNDVTTPTKENIANTSTKDECKVVESLSSDKTGDNDDKTKVVDIKDEAEHSKEVEIRCDSNSGDTFKFCIQTNLTNLSRSEEISAIALATLSEINTDQESSNIGNLSVDVSLTSDIKLSEINTDQESSNIGNLSVDVPLTSDIKYPEKLSEPEMVAIEGNLTVMSEKDFADAQVEITTNKVISSIKPVMLSNFSMDFSDSTSDSGSINDTSSEASSKFDFDSKGTEFTSRAMTKEIKPKVTTKKANAYDQCELLDILEGNIEADKKVVEFQTPTKKFTGDICDFEEHIPSQIVCTKQFKQDLDDEFKKKDKSTVISTTSKLLERLTELKTETKQETTTDSLLKNFQQTKPKSKPIILSEQIIKPASDPKKVIPPTNAVNDIEDVEAFVIHKDIKKHIEVEEENVAPVKTIRKPRLKPSGKAKILQQTIITPAGEILQPTVTLQKKKTILVNAPVSSVTTRVTADATSSIASNKTSKATVTVASSTVTTNQDDHDFDIFNMPIVLSDQILTPESLENIPIVLDSSTSVTKPTQTLIPTSTTKLSSTKIMTKIVSTATSTLVSSKPLNVSPKITKPRILQTVSTKPGVSLPSGILSRTAKPGKYILVSQSASSSTPQKTLIKKAIIKRPAVAANVTSKVSGVPEGIGNKVMVVTNQQGQQQRLLLTPAQQKVLGYQTTVGTKLAKTVVKTNIIQKNLLTPVSKAEIGTPTLIGQKVVTTSSQVISKSLPRSIRPIPKKISTAQKVIPIGKTPKTILITNKHGQTIKKIATTEDDIDKQVAEQLEAIKASSGMHFASQAKSDTVNTRPLQKPTIRRTFSKKQEPKLKITPTITKSEIVTNPPPLVSTSRKIVSTITETKKVIQEEPKLQIDRPLNQLVIQDALGNQTTITEGQILALPSETVDGQPQSYMLVTLDQSGNLTPLNNEALMSLDPNLGLGGDLSNMVLQIDQAALGSGNLDQPLPLAQPATVKITNPGEELQAGTSKIEIPRVTVPLSLPVVSDPISTEQKVEHNVILAPAEPTVNIESIVSNSNGEQGQQLIVTGDPIATQKFLESLTEGTTDLANIIANAEGKSILIHADGQQILINTNSDNQMLANVAESTEGGGNPIFATQPNKNTDILAAALADTDVFTSHPKISSQLSPNNGLYPINVGNVLETSLTLSSPIMTPLEVPSTNNKKIADDEVDILSQVPKNVDLPITITDPNISQTVANQQVILMGSEFPTNLDLGLTITETAIPSVSTGLTSPGFNYSLPSLDESDLTHKPFNSSMPLLNDEVDDTTLSDKKSDKDDKNAHINPESFLEEESRFTLGGGMCSSLSEPPPEMFDIPDVNNFSEKNNSNIPLSLQSTPDPKDDDTTTDVSIQAESSSEGSCEIPLQPKIVAKSVDLSEASEI